MKEKNNAWELIGLDFLFLPQYFLKGICQKFKRKKLTSCCPVLSKKFFFKKKIFEKKIFFKKKKSENSDPPSLETLLKAKNTFFTIKKSCFWRTNFRKLVTMVSWHIHQPSLPMVLEGTFMPVF